MRNKEVLNNFKRTYLIATHSTDYKTFIISVYNLFTVDHHLSVVNINYKLTGIHHYSHLKQIIGCYTSLSELFKKTENLIYNFLFAEMQSDLILFL